MMRDACVTVDTFWRVRAVEHARALPTVRSETRAVAILVWSMWYHHIDRSSAWRADCRRCGQYRRRHVYPDAAYRRGWYASERSRQSGMAVAGADQWSSSLEHTRTCVCARAARHLLVSRNGVRDRRHEGGGRQLEGRAAPAMGATHRRTIDCRAVVANVSPANLNDLVSSETHMPVLRTAHAV